MTFGCKHCGSARLEDIGRVMNHVHHKCQSCGHLHIGETLYHDRYCCDRIYQKGGGAKGSTAASRALHMLALDELQEAVRDGQALRLTQLIPSDELPHDSHESSSESSDPSESPSKTSLLGFVRKLVGLGG